MIAVEPDSHQAEIQDIRSPKESPSVESEDRSPSKDNSPTLSVSSSARSSLSSSSEGSVHKRIMTARSGVEDAIRRLNRLSVSVRRSGFHRYDPRAMSFAHIKDGENLTLAFKEIATLKLKWKYPEADEALRERLAESMSRRRNLIAYRQKHHQKLSYNNPVSAQSIQKKPQTFVGSAEHPTSSQPDTTRRQDELQSETSASHLEPERIGVQSKPTSSQASTVISKSPTQRAALNFPRAPPVKNNDNFQCPYCCILCPAKEARGKYWKSVMIVFNLFFVQLF